MSCTDCLEEHKDYVEIYIVNETKKDVDLCIGHDQELTVEPGCKDLITVKVRDGDVLYIDRIGVTVTVGE